MISNLTRKSYLRSQGSFRGDILRLTFLQAFSITVMSSPESLTVFLILFSSQKFFVSPSKIEQRLSVEFWPQETEQLENLKYSLPWKTCWRSQPCSSFSSHLDQVNSTVFPLELSILPTVRYITLPTWGRTTRWECWWSSLSWGPTGGKCGRVPWKGCRYKELSCSCRSCLPGSLL